MYELYNGSRRQGLHPPQIGGKVRKSALPAQTCEKAPLVEGRDEEGGSFGVSGGGDRLVRGQIEWGGG